MPCVLRIAVLKEELDALALDSAGVARSLHLPNACTPGDFDSFVSLSERLAGAPELSQAAMASDAWESPADEVAALLAHGAACSALGSGLTPSLLVEAFAAAVNEDRTTLAALVVGPASASGWWDGEEFDRLRRLSSLIAEIEEQAGRLRHRLGRLRNLVVDKAALGEALFGDRWHGTNSDWAWLRSAADWMHANGELRIGASELPDPAAPLALLRSVLTRREPWVAACADLLRDLQITLVGAFSEVIADIRSVPWAQLSHRMDGWLKHPEQLSRGWPFVIARNALGRWP